jgi:hypothetical protein
MKKLLVLCLLTLGAPAAGSRAPQPAPTKTATRSSDADKANVLYQMARFKWRISKPSEPMPAFEQTSTKAFLESVKRGASDGNPAGIRSLYEKIWAHFKKPHTYEQATATELRAAVADVLKSKYTGSPNQSRIEAFADSLSQNQATAKDTAAGKSTDLQSNANQDLKIPSGEEQGKKAKKVAGANHQDAPLPVTPHTELSWWKILSWLGIGFSAGAAASWFWLNGQHAERLRNRENNLRNSAKKEAYGLLSEIKNLKESLTDKNKQIDKQEVQLRELNSKLTALAKTQSGNKGQKNAPASADSVLPSPVSPIEPPVAPMSEIREVVLSPTPTGATGQRRYAVVPDGSQLQQYDLQSTSMPHMEIAITISDPDETRATFEFRPEAQERVLKGNLRRQLGAFFDFDLPPVDTFSRIANVAPGLLERSGDTWTVKKPARLTIS